MLITDPGRMEVPFDSTGTNLHFTKEQKGGLVTTNWGDKACLVAFSDMT